MLVGYLDTSVLVAITFAEPGYERLVAKLGLLDEIVSSTLLESEFLAAAEREGVRDRVSKLLDGISWIFPENRLTRELNEFLGFGYLRGADLHHLATALHLFPKPDDGFFLTLDQRQEGFALKLGFKCLAEL